MIILVEKQYCKNVSFIRWLVDYLVREHFVPQDIFLLLIPKPQLIIIALNCPYYNLTNVVCWSLQCFTRKVVDYQEKLYNQKNEMFKQEFHKQKIIYQLLDEKDLSKDIVCNKWY